MTKTRYVADKLIKTFDSMTVIIDTDRVVKAYNKDYVIESCGNVSTIKISRLNGGKILLALLDGNYITEEKEIKLSVSYCNDLEILRHLIDAITEYEKKYEEMD